MLQLNSSLKMNERDGDPIKDFRMIGRIQKERNREDLHRHALYAEGEDLLH